MPLFFPVFGLLHWVDRIILALRKRGLHVFCVIVETPFDLIPNKGLPHYTLKRYCYEIYVFIGVIAKGCESERWDLGVKNLRKIFFGIGPQRARAGTPGHAMAQESSFGIQVWSQKQARKKIGGKGTISGKWHPQPALLPTKWVIRANRSAGDINI